MLTKEIPTPRIFFKGQMPVPVGQIIEIQEIRYSHIDQAFEANKIVVRTSGILFESDRQSDLQRGRWRKEIIIGELQEVTVASEKTVFTLANVSGRDFEEYYW
jgi:hypothetical protein